MCVAKNSACAMFDLLRCVGQPIQMNVPEKVNGGRCWTCIFCLYKGRCWLGLMTIQMNVPKEMEGAGLEFVVCPKEGVGWA